MLVYLAGQFVDYIAAVKCLLRKEAYLWKISNGALLAIIKKYGMDLLVSNIVQGVNEQNNIVNEYLSRWLISQKSDHC